MNKYNSIANIKKAEHWLCSEIYPQVVNIASISFKEETLYLCVLSFHISLPILNCIINTNLIQTNSFYIILGNYSIEKVTYEPFLVNSDCFLLNIYEYFTNTYNAICKNYLISLHF
jgi:hypothetical protein